MIIFSTIKNGDTTYAVWDNFKLHNYIKKDGTSVGTVYTI